MKLVASLTATGLLGFLLLEALKILLAPVAAWLLGFVMVAVKFFLIGSAIIAVVIGSVFAWRWIAKNREKNGY